jgi:hypothetical protein
MWILFSSCFGCNHFFVSEPAPCPQLVFFAFS